MRSNQKPSRESLSPLPLRLAAIAAVLFLHLPVLIILLYAFTTDEAT
jgi:putative spermidine/putrescine transport system permease protein